MAYTKFQNQDITNIKSTTPSKKDGVMLYTCKKGLTTQEQRLRYVYDKNYQEVSEWK